MSPSCKMCENCKHFSLLNKFCTKHQTSRNNKDCCSDFVSFKEEPKQGSCGDCSGCGGGCGHPCCSDDDCDGCNMYQLFSNSLT